MNWVRGQGGFILMLRSQVVSLKVLTKIDGHGCVFVTLSTELP